MKKLLLILLYLIFYFDVSAQLADTLYNSEVSMLLDKAKKQKNTAWTLLGIGIGASVVGLFVFNAGLEDSGDSDDGTRLAQGLILSTAGGLCVYGSLPLFIASGRNKRKAAAVISFKMENSSYIHQYTMTENKYPAIALKVGF